ncbi:MAG: 4-hydroxy-tetrahydrodipicolinate synthase [Firmicutes bacterium]|nr:4-hydroxy-tetrahydrodipicolinate synthase [Bacillota bacterium]
MANHLFVGAATALVTPMNGDGTVNYDEFGNLIDWQIDEQIDALVIAGTTGEGATLSDEEHRAVMEFAGKRINGRIPWIAGTGSNDTAYGIDLSKAAADAGADAVLLVTPYYNKTTQGGLVKMFYEYADALSVPVVLYNVPSRTGINIEPDTYVELGKHDNIVAIKEANSDIAKIVETKAKVGDSLDLYSGNDDQIVPLLSIGALGVVSVLSNVLPRETHEMVHAYINGDLEKACELQLKYVNLVKALFCETNPIPVKCAMSHLGFCGNNLRSPLFPIEPQHEALLLNAMKEAGVNVKC